MITSTNIWPRTWDSLYNPIVYTVTSNKSSEDGFKYVFDVYINGIKKSTIKQPKNPSGRGIIDVSRIIRNYLQIKDFSVDFDMLTGFSIKTGESQTLRFNILVGEEYFVGSNYVIYDGITNSAPGSPSFNPNTGSTSGILPQAVSSALDPFEYKSNLSTFGGSYPTDRYSLQDRLAMSRWVSTDSKTLKSYDNEILSLISNVPTLSIGLDQQRYIYGLRTTWYSSTGPIGTSDIYNTVSNGGGPWISPTGNYSISTTPDSKYSVINVGVGPNNHYNGSVPTGTTYYDVQAYLPQLSGTGAVNGNFGLSASVKYTYVIDECDHDSSGFKRVRLVWLNDLGGWDSFNFTKANSEQYSKETQTYYNNSQNFSNVWSFDPYKGGILNYDSKIEVSYTIMSDWITENESNFLKYLFKSPRVFAYFLESGSEIARPVIITDQSYDVKNYAREKVFNYTFSIKESQIYNSQTL